MNTIPTKLKTGDEVVVVTGKDKGKKGTLRKILKAKNKPNADITIYRAVPKNVKNINKGDFVTLSPKYAELHAASGYGRRGNEAGKVIKQKVKVKDLIWDANDVNEFGYFPQGKL